MLGRGEATVNSKNQLRELGTERSHLRNTTRGPLRMGSHQGPCSPRPLQRIQTETPQTEGDPGRAPDRGDPGLKSRSGVSG